MKKQRRDIQIFSLSFLDCICCGFGAVILLFVLSKFAEPLIIEEVKVDLEAKIIRLEEELVEIRGETAILNRDLTAKKEQLSQEKIRLARLQGDISKIEGQFAGSKDTAQVQNIIEGKLARAMQELTEEMRRLLKTQPRKIDRSVGGIPVEKWILRKAFEDLLPSDIVWRDKEQFDEGSGMVDLLPAVLESTAAGIDTDDYKARFTADRLRSNEECLYHSLLMEQFVCVLMDKHGEFLRPRQLLLKRDGPA